ncbi:hypothetical protein KQX54_015438 [Cotesia glomerata]|uniref:BTB domain-containing protein n=1 Tax=Cotesia glomerata TaxID=32391 RepID=A0AAV7I9F0_COTGL|nr:hypothetical protein KQX54_015438 [Cotesia glomerata]
MYDDYTLIDNTIKPLKTLKRKINYDFRELLTTKKNVILTLPMGDQTFQAHKTILAASSSMFDAMFSRDIKENREKAITIPDVDPNVFEKILEFIYTNQVNNLVISDPYKKYVAGCLIDSEYWNPIDNYFDGGTLPIDDLLKKKMSFYQMIP